MWKPAIYLSLRPVTSTRDSGTDARLRSSVRRPRLELPPECSLLQRDATSVTCGDGRSFGECALEWSRSRVPAYRSSVCSVSSVGF